MGTGARRYTSFADFYPFYLSEHSNRVSRRLHFAGTTLAIGLMLSAILSLQPWYALAAVISGYAFAWVGHAFFEKNRPATFTYPFYSLMGDFVMWRDILVGRMKF